MSLPAVEPTARETRPPIALLAVLATLAFLGLQAAGGFSTLRNFGTDNDSLLRLVEVRDLLGGQGWFDLTQARLGPGGGVVMHWSRLVDAPVAIVILAGEALTGDRATAEALALVAWPLLLFGLGLAALGRAARDLAGGDAVLPAILLGATIFHYLGIFAPGALDHHNVQLVLCLAALACLTRAMTRGDALRLGVLAGTACAVSLAVAMEAAPSIAATGLAVALWLAVDPQASRGTAVGFGLALALACLALFAATVPSSHWGEVACDAYSLPQLVAAGISGLGLAAMAAASSRLRTLTARLMALAGVGVVLGAVMVVAFPQCLADPYAGLDPRLRDWWLDQVAEAQPVWSVVRSDAALAAGRYVTPVVALAWIGFAVIRGKARASWLPAGGLLLSAFIVSLWQVRGSSVSLALAALPLAAMIGGARSRASASPSARSILVMAGAWLVSLNVAWSGLAGALDRDPAGEPAAGASSTPACDTDRDFAALAALPTTGVLAISNLGAPILRFTPHRVLAGPYHRNVAGNLAVIEAFAGSGEAAHALMERESLGLLALCPGDPETGFIAARAPDGFLAQLAAGEIPDWLIPVRPASDLALKLYGLRANR